MNQILQSKSICFSKSFSKVCMFLALFTSVIQMSAQNYEAESATLSGGAVIQNNANASGGKIVASQEGNLTFNLTLTETAYYNIYIYAASPNGEKTNNFALNGSSTSFYLPLNTAYTKLKVVTNQKLSLGALKVEIIKSWGWINIDYIQFEKVDPATRFNINTTLVTPNSIPEATAMYKYLYDNYGKKILSGVMTLNSFDESNWLKQNTGKEPVVLGLDFMHVNRKYTWHNDQTIGNDAKAWYAKNGIPIICWHWRDPSRITEEFYTSKTTFDISKVNDVTSAEYKAMLSDIDYIAGLLKPLQTAGVPVIWRPLHEAAGGWFWWGAKGAAPCKKLYLLMYDRMVNFHGLKNLIWVWTREPNDDLWYPGDAYVDIVGRDIYKDGDHTSQVIEFNDMNARYGGKKMVTISECGSMPDVDNLIADGANWSWWMPWYGGYTRDVKYNSLDLWKKMFASDYVITLDEMPALKTYGLVTAISNVNDEKQTLIYPTLVEDILNIKCRDKIQTISVFNILGEKVYQHHSENTTLQISLAELKSGIYFIKVNNQKSVKIVKL